MNQHAALAETQCADCRQLIDRHLSYCAYRELAPSTIRARRWLLHRLARYLHSRKRCLLTAEIGDLLSWQSTLTCGPSGRRGYVQHARALYHWTASQGMRGADLVGILQLPKQPRRLPRPIPDADLSRAITAAPPRIRPWLLLAALAGLRACEIALLRREDLGLELVPPTITVTGKGKHVRTVPIGPWLATELRTMDLPARGWLFPKLSRGTHEPVGGHVTAHQVSHLACNWLHHSGTESTLHALRHRFATDAYRDCLDPFVVRDLLGHASVATTQIYAAAVPDKAAAVVARIDRARMERIGVHRGVRILARGAVGQ